MTLLPCTQYLGPRTLKLRLCAVMMLVRPHNPGFALQVPYCGARSGQLVRPRCGAQGPVWRGHGGGRRCAAVVRGVPAVHAGRYPHKALLTCRVSWRPAQASVTGCNDAPWSGHRLQLQAATTPPGQGGDPRKLELDS
eukprot:366064-Chlamydomonas_euryale.AAC.16